MRVRCCASYIEGAFPYVPFGQASRGMLRAQPSGRRAGRRALRLRSRQALRLRSRQALRLRSGQALRLRSGQALRLRSGQGCRLASSTIQRGAHGQSAALENVGIDHGGLYILMAEQFLDGADIVTALQKVGGEGVPKGRLRAGGRCEERRVCQFWRRARRAGQLFAGRFRPSGGAWSFLRPGQWMWIRRGRGIAR